MPVVEIPWLVKYRHERAWWTHYNDIALLFKGKTCSEALITMITKLRIYDCEVVWACCGTWLILGARWRRPSPIPPARRLFFYLVFCFIIWLVWVDFCFCLHSCDAKFSWFELISMHSTVLFFLFFAFYSVCVGGGR